MVDFTPDPISPELSYNLLKNEKSGSIVLHYAVVKADGGRPLLTTAIDYQSCGETVAEMSEIAAEIQKRFALEDLLIIRRSGILGVGEIISLVAASSPNSEDAFESCKYGISLLKKMKTIRKTEMTVGEV